MADQKQNLEACPVALVVNEDTRQKVLKAINGGGLDGVNELSANLLAGMYELGASELSKLRHEGFTIERPIVNKDGDVSGYVPSVNPSAEPTLKLLEMLGATGAQATVTNKSRGEKAVGESIDDLAKLLMGRAASRTVDVTPEKKAIEP